MHEGAPGAGFSNELNNGSMSSQPASRPWALRGAASEKSGARNGLASWAATTERGTTCRSLRAADTAGRCCSTSGSGSSPPAICISRFILRAESLTSASSPSRVNKDGSRVAVCARIFAMPSSRFSCASRCGSVIDVSALTRARSSRARSAMAWNLLRSISPCRTWVSTARTALARTGRIPSFSRGRRCAGRDVPVRPERRRGCANRVSSPFTTRPGSDPGRGTESANPRSPLSVRRDARAATRASTGPTHTAERRGADLT